MFCSHFFDEILEGLFHIDHQHHANEPNDANLTTKCGQQSMDKVVCDVLAMTNEENFKTQNGCVIRVSTYPLVFGFLVEALLHSLHPQLLLGRVHVEKGFSAQVQFLKTGVVLMC